MALRALRYQTSDLFGGEGKHPAFISG